MTPNYAVTKNFFIRALITALPSRMKRIVFLASLTAIAKESNVPEKVLLGKLNEVLNLSSTGDAALKLPIHISKLIWANEQVFKADIQLLTKCQEDPQMAQQSAERIAGATPKWFVYGDKGALINDILALFSTSNRIFTKEARTGVQLG
jgi:hypothetical protein